METTGLPSGTVYPAMRRLERDELIRSQWENQSIADADSARRENTISSRAPDHRARSVAKALSPARQADSVRRRPSTVMTITAPRDRSHAPHARSDTPRSAALLVPGRQRDEWLAEWRAQLCYVRGRGGKGTTAFCLGAIPDALWLRRNSPR